MVIDNIRKIISPRHEAWFYARQSQSLISHIWLRETSLKLQIGEEANEGNQVGNWI